MINQRLKIHTARLEKLPIEIPSRARDLASVNEYHILQRV